MEQEEIEKAQMTLLEAGMKIIVPCQTTNADQRPIYEVIIYPIFQKGEVIKNARLRETI